ncbi:MAG: hypothetical protein JY451_07045 [Erythrobacter sp.]|nr:MAG: hypothetical protein JY451_07045 [Erythrobacter sp.]
MDTLRGSFGPHDALDLDGFAMPDFGAVDEDDMSYDAPPPAIGTDERRMQVRAYNFWASLLEDRNFPSIEDLDPTLLPDFGPHSVLLDFSTGIENPGIEYIGNALADECCAIADATPRRLSDVPPRSLLSRITDHYMQILANQSPIGFEAEFVNAMGATILYRGILLPFSSNDESIDFIFGVINWKELADARSSGELLLEIDQALDAGLTFGDRQPRRPALTDWADGPANVLGDDLLAESGNAFAATRPVPSIDLDGQAEMASDSFDPAAMELADWLAAAREMAQQAKGTEERTRAALYEAVGRAWDFAIAAGDAPDDFAELLEDAGIAMQERAPMTPVVKLVFGVDYDKTRLTEYAAVLAFADRNGIAQGSLGAYLKTAEGGLKGVVASERAFRRAQDGKPAQPIHKGPRKAIAKRLRALAPLQFDSLAIEGDEFALVMIRRDATGQVVVLGEVPGNTALVEKAARELIG